MGETDCPFHRDHENRILENEKNIKENESNLRELNERVVQLDKDFSISYATITNSLKSLEKLPDTMLQISTTMVSMQGEIKKSTDRMGNIETRLSTLDSRIEQVDEEGKFNIRRWIKSNWIGLGMGLAALAYFASEFIKGMVK